ncbi:MAG: hypothetical protein IKR19_08785 [Acholeplasmatales bacterium]|nr:hypothetical protein [Acholeplasmatales bacterium]
MSDYHDEDFTDDITVRSRASINMTLHSKNFYLHEFRHNDCNPIAIDIYNIMSDNLKTIFNIKYLADKRLIKENS